MMAHIADLLLAITSNGAVSPKQKGDLPSPIPLEISKKSSEDIETTADTHVWRLHHSQKTLSQSPPSIKVEAVDGSKHVRNKSSCQSQSDASGMRPKSKQNDAKPNSRRKINVLELAPMTTVNESAMDSPTIPGRPAVHGRSLSLSVTSQYDHPDQSRSPEFYESSQDDDSEFSSSEENPISCKSSQRPMCTVNEANISVLYDGNSSGTHSNLLNINNNFKGPENVNKPTKGNHPSFSFSKPPKVSPLATILAWSSAVTLSSHSEGRSSPRPWNITSRSSPKSSPRTTPDTIISPPMLPVTPPFCTHYNSSVTVLDTSPGKSVPHPSHHYSEARERSHSRAGDRGRLNRRLHGDLSSSSSFSSFSESHSRCSSRNPTVSTSTCYDDERSTSPSSPSEQHCFLNLPTGHLPKKASQNLSQTEVSQLQNQALSQARRFRILPSRDVESLSRELRALDERCEYLRSTHHNLRNERKSLHSRICSYLRSHRVARFSVEALLKQEESLAELDRSIDSWISKLEQADNRRIRIRQKLLEHVAAAAILDKYNDGTEQSTPPRSPQHSPDRLERVLEETQPKVNLETPTSSNFNDESSPKHTERPISSSEQSIRVYFDDDVYALMDYVEEEIVRHGM